MDYLQKNLTLLRHKDPLLAEYIADLNDSKNMVVVESTSGSPTLKIIHNDRRSKFLHSPENPVSEAKNFLNGYSFNNEDGTILFGFGLGYLVKEIAKRKAQNHVLYVVEGIPGLFKLAMVHQDLSDLLADDNIFFFVGDSIYRIIDGFEPIQIKAITGTINKLAIPSLKAVCPALYDGMDRVINDYVKSLQISFNSFDALKEIRLVNLFRNIPALLNSGAVNNLENLIGGNPALVIAAGPSLSKDVAAIRNRPANCVTICVDAALKPLVENGIRPDLAVTCDPSSNNYNKVAKLSREDIGSIPLVYQADVTPELIERFEGHRFILNAHNSLTARMTNTGRSVITFPPFQTVSHLAFFLARFMGADPIILVGLDLSFPGEKDHAVGCAHTWKPDFEKGNFQWIPSTNGGKVKTFQDFLSMIHLLENEIRNTTARCINVSRDGAMIKGTEWMPLEKALELTSDNFPSNSAMPIGDLLAGAFTVDPGKLKIEYSYALTWLISEVENLAEICHDAQKLVNEAIPHRTDERKKQIFHERVNLLYQSAFRHKDLLDILTDYLPRYMISCSKDPLVELSEANVSSMMVNQERIGLFFEELDALLPMLREHSHSASANLKNL